MADGECARSLSALLSGIAQREFLDRPELSAPRLKEQLYPQLPLQDFTALHDKMRGLIKSMASADMDHSQLEVFLSAQTKKQGGGGVSVAQADALARFWKTHRVKVNESLLAQSRGEPSLRGLSWRVDVQAATGREQGGEVHGGPVGVMELELGRAGQDSQFVCLEFDEVQVSQVLEKMADILESIERLAHIS